MEEDKSDNHITKAIAAAFNKGGISAVRDLVQSNLEQWGSATVSIALIGRTGVGKSTLINILRNVKDDESSAALTGTTETTTEIKSYQDRNNPNINFFDLPCVGSERFPKETYLKNIPLDHFDTYLLMTAIRFTDDDAWLAEKLKAMGKPFFFVRTKVWNDVENVNRNVIFRKPEEQIIVEIRENCKKNLKNKDAKIFLIDSFNERNEKLDFKELRVAMSEDLPELKRQALFDSYQDFTMFTPTLIKKKGEMLRKRIWKAACLSGGYGLLPSQLFSMSVDLGIVQKEVSFFANQLGLRKNMSISRGVSLEEETVFKLKQTASLWLKDVSEEDVKALRITEKVKRSTWFIPIINLIVSGISSYWGTNIVLNKLLDKIIDDALEINTLISIDLAKGVGV